MTDPEAEGLTPDETHSQKPIELAPSRWMYGSGRF